MFMSILQFQESSIFVDACSVTQNPQLNNFQSQAVFVWIWSNWSRHMAGNCEHISLLPLPRTSWVPHILSCSNCEINWLQIGLVTHTQTTKWFWLDSFFWNIYIKDHLFNIQILQTFRWAHNIYVFILRPFITRKPSWNLSAPRLLRIYGTEMELDENSCICCSYFKDGKRPGSVVLKCQFFAVDADMFMHFVAEVRTNWHMKKNKLKQYTNQEPKVKHHQSSWIFLEICAG